MCARIIQDVDVHALGRTYRVQVDNTDPQIPIRWNGAPGADYTLCRVRDRARELATLRWGLVPAWASTPDFAPVNARAETAGVKPTFRDAFRHRRCVLPVLGWYEWRRDGRRKTPFLIRDAGGQTMHLAALWERGRGAGGRVDGFTVLTTDPRNELRAIHDRQPAVLDTPTSTTGSTRRRRADAYRRWPKAAGAGRCACGPSPPSTGQP